MGRAISQALAQSGWAVVVHHRRSPQEAQTLVDSLQEQGHVAEALALDLDALCPDALDAQFRDIEARLGPVRLLVNNASRFEFDSAASAHSQGLEAHMRSNLMGPVLCTQALYRHCQRASPPAQGHSVGVVVNLLDQKLANPNPDFFSYTLSKAALQEATHLMARAFAPTLRVVGVSPGISLPSADQTPSEFERAHRLTPLGQSSTPEEVADAVVWLAGARAVTGTTLLVDGGQHLVPSDRDVMFLSR